MLRVLVASDIRLFREGIAARLAAIGNVEVMSSSEDSEDLLEVMGEDIPDVLLVMIGSPATLNSVRAVARTIPDLPIVALGIPEEAQVVIPCAEAGIVGYIPPDGSLADLVDVVTSALHGEAIVSPRIAGSLVRHVSVLASTSASGRRWSRHHPLTSREREVAELLEQGFSNKQIGKRLGIRLPTVKNHVHSILGKLQVDRRGKVARTLRDARATRRSAHLSP